VCDSLSAAKGIYFISLVFVIASKNRATLHILAPNFICAPLVLGAYYMLRWAQHDDKIAEAKEPLRTSLSLRRYMAN
jgi:hypothetical protein